MYCDIDYTHHHTPFTCFSAAHPVGSSVMLLGGFGFLSRLHGLSIDNLVEAEMVLADGRIAYVSENENPGSCAACSLSLQPDVLRQRSVYWF